MILVTGSGGTVGTELTSLLHAGEVPFRAACHSPGTLARLRAKGYDAVPADLSDPDTLGPALVGVEKVFLLAATGPDQVGHERNLIAAAAAAGVRHIVKLSVWRADEELTPIARLHRPGELALADSAMTWTLLRPNFFMRTFVTSWGPSIRANGVFAGPLIRGPIALVDTSDVAAAALRVLTESGHEGKAYSLTGPEAITYADAAGVLSDVLGRTVRYEGLSDARARELLPQAGVSQFQTELLIGVSAAYRDGGAETITPAVRELTGRKPVSFARFAAEHRAAFG